MSHLPFLFSNILRRERFERKMNHILVTVGEDKIAFPIGSVLAAYPMPNLTSIPNLPEHVLGLAIVRNQALPVVDLIKSDSKKMILLLSNDSDEFGLVVNEVNGIIDIPVDEVVPVKNTSDDAVISTSGKQESNIPNISNWAVILDSPKSKPNLFAEYSLGVWFNRDDSTRGDFGEAGEIWVINPKNLVWLKEEKNVA